MIDSGTAGSIRDMSERDLGWMAQYERDIFGAAAWSSAMIADDYHSGLRTYRCVEDGGTPIAYAVYGLEADAAHLMNLAVMPDYRGRGWARALVEDFLTWARRGDFREACLEVAATNVAAEHLYRDYGFEVVRVRKRYYQPEDVDAMVMRLALRQGVQVHER